ncbi:hypothetical protein JCM17845_23040 [Iodidimonas gelatinilytica]|uniref:Uncharacterized protein n=1 Tax=Iodidimonas gelatinilytica TaxID=1236966 RepID=A0A5A7N028_9PROT|nr:hypothetical protein JCM17845_23040 [Iodidimonas gelatinilytica]
MQIRLDPGGGRIGIAKLLSDGLVPIAKALGDGVFPAANRPAISVQIPAV